MFCIWMFSKEDTICYNIQYASTTQTLQWMLLYPTLFIFPTQSLITSYFNMYITCITRVSIASLQASLVCSWTDQTYNHCSLWYVQTKYSAFTLLSSQFHLAYHLKITLDFQFSRLKRNAKVLSLHIMHLSIVVSCRGLSCQSQYYLF